MRDVLLLRTLARDPHGPLAATLLAEAAGTHMDLRWPVLGAVDAALSSREARVRAGAQGVLGGVGGHAALVRIVEALDDGSAAVRAAAGDALRASSEGDPARLAHALFHPREDVRRRALRSWNDGPGTRAGPLAWLPLLLVADAALASEARTHLPSIAAPADALPAVLGLLEIGALDRPSARRVVQQGMKPGTAIASLECCRPPAEARAVVHDLLSGVPITHLLSDAPTAPARAPIDGLMDLFADDPAPSGSAAGAPAPAPAPAVGGDDAAVIARFLAEASALLGRGSFKMGAAVPFEAAQTLAAIALTTARRGAWSAGLAGLAALCEPSILVLPAIPIDVRRTAALALARIAVRRRIAPPEWLLPALSSPLVVLEGGALDLEVAAALLRMSETEPIAMLRRAHTAEALAAQAARDPFSLAPILSMEAATLEGRLHLFHLAAAGGKVARADLFAVLLARAPIDAWGPFDTVDRRDAIATAERLLSLAEPSAGGVGEGFPLPGQKPRPSLLPEDRAHRVAAAIAARALAGGAEAGAARLLAALLAAPGALEGSFGKALLEEVARLSGAEAFAGAVLSLPTADIRRVALAIAAATTFPRGKEMLLAQVLRDSPDADVRAWASAPCVEDEAIETHAAAAKAAAAAAEATPAATPLARVLRSAEAEAIRTAAGPAALVAALEPALREPRAGVASVLLSRTPGPEPSVEACAALLAAHDAPEEVARALQRHGSLEPAFLERLDAYFVRRFCSCAALPVHGDAWLHLFEQRLRTFAERAAASVPAIVAVLALARALPFTPLASMHAGAVGRHLEILAARERKRFEALVDDALVEALVDALLDPRTASGAAAGIAAIQRSGARRVVLAPHRDRVGARLGDLDEDVRFKIRDWIDASGVRAGPLTDRPALRRERENEARWAFPGPDLAPAIAALGGADGERAETAALRLALGGEAGAAALLEALTAPTPAREEETPSRPSRLKAPPAWPGVPALLAAQTLALWPEGPSLESAAAAVASEITLEPELRFLAAAGLLERGRSAHVPHLLAAAAAPSLRRWFRSPDTAVVERLCPDARAAAIALAPSPHFHAYAKAVDRLLALELEHPAEAPDTAVLEALATFLDQGCQRPIDLRLRAARRLRARGDACGLPILLRDAARRGATEAKEALGEGPLDAASARIAIGSVLAAGPAIAEERLLRAIIDRAPPEEVPSLLARIADEARAGPIRLDATRRLLSGDRRRATVQALAARFAWGVRTGRELMRRLFRFRPLAGDELGYTRLETSDIHVNVLPVLRGLPEGADVVDGLIVHELGHHLYHAAKEGLAAWKTSAEEGIQRLFNVVLDEHLERNLRALSDEYGDKLKRLGAYAFQRRSGERPLALVIAALQHRSAAALAAAPPAVARKAGHVLVQDGKLLVALERAGSSFSRFFRALRQGLGNRAGDPRVAQALELFGKGFRASSIERLLEIARELKRIFGAETLGLERGLDGTAGNDGDAEEREARRAGITDEEIDAEVRRILEPPRKGRDTGERLPEHAINVGPDERVNTIGKVVPLEYDRDAAAALTKQVARPAALLRRYLASLGLVYAARPMRVRGRRVDPARLRPLVLRGDPRALKARELETENDLFVGIVVDCSGSMRSADRIGRARLMAALIAEAVRGLEGIDARFFGFTDDVIYDAGDARRPAVHALQAGGGNDDAAALSYAAGVARRSKRRARLLVMISDGLPTECSVAALRGLVRRLGRQGYSCAQVALRPLEEILFPHYVVVEGGELDAAVRRFGRIIARLVRGAVKR